MPLPLVIELQQLAQVGATDVCELLRRAKVVASKLKLDDFDEWFDFELNGYPESADVPDYRVVSSRLMTKSPYHGLQPVFFKGEGEPKPGQFSLASHFSSMKMRQPIAQVAHLVVNIMRGDGSGVLACSLGDGEMNALVEGEARFRLVEPVRILNNGDVVAILDAVRNRILKWSLDLERKEILGGDMMFTVDEQQRAAAQITINNYGSLGSVVHGSGSTVTTMQNSPDGEVAVATGAARLMKRLAGAVEAMRSLDSQAAIAIERVAEGLTRADLSDDARVEASEVLAVVAEQSMLVEQSRMPKSVLASLVTKLRDSLSLTADLVQVWTTFGPSIVAWLGVRLK